MNMCWPWPWHHDDLGEADRNVDARAPPDCSLTMFPFLRSPNSLFREAPCERPRVCWLLPSAPSTLPSASLSLQRKGALCGRGWGLGSHLDARGATSSCTELCGRFIQALPSSPKTVLLAEGTGRASTALRVPRNGALCGREERLASHIGVTRMAFSCSRRGGRFNPALPGRRLGGGGPPLSKKHCSRSRAVSSRGPRETLAPSMSLTYEDWAGANPFGK